MKVSRPFYESFESDCASCGELILVDDEMHYVDDEPTCEACTREVIETRWPTSWLQGFRDVDERGSEVSEL